MSNPSAASTPSSHLSDVPIIVIFVIGGISFNEVKQIQDELLVHVNNNNSGMREEFSCRIIIGSNKVVSPDDLFYELFLQNNK